MGIGPSKPKYLLVEDYIKQQVKEKKIISKLPGERNLAKELGISYMTIRKAVDNLVAIDFLYKVPTKGTYVVEQNDSKKVKTKTKTVGYFLDSKIVGGLSSPYYAKIFDALEKTASQAGYSLIYFSDADKINLHKVFTKLDGVVASCFSRIEPLIQQINNTVPVVVIDNKTKDNNTPSVIIDNYNALIQSVKYLCSLGHNRIGFMMGLEDSDVGLNRFEGYKSGLIKHEIGFDPILVFKGNYTFGSGEQGVEYFQQLKQKPTAIICANDSMALGAMKMLHQLKIKVPEDISIIGFDDIDVARQLTPSLTTVSVPTDQIAECAFKILRDLIEEKPLDDEHILLNANLITRNTCASITSSSYEDNSINSLSTIA